jgi:hypothetical protein
MRPPFKPTHRLRHQFYGLPAGTPVRQVNPFGDNERMVYTEEEWIEGCRDPWFCHPLDLEPLPEWEQIRQQQIDYLCKRK